MSDKSFPVPSRAERRRAARCKPVNRQQLLLRSVDVEKLVEEDHCVRAIWELVDRADLETFYETIEAVEGEAGCSAWDPRVLISLWIYAYSRAVSSAREISRRCEYDPAYQWLIGLEVVNHHTLAAFGREVGEKMEEADSEELSERVVKARERAVRERKERLEAALRELKHMQAAQSDPQKRQKARVSTTDPEGRIMQQPGGGFAPSYNVQISTDAQATVIVGLGVSQAANDTGELVPAMERVEGNLGEVPQQVVVDGGFINQGTIKAMEAQGMDLMGPMPDHASQTVAALEKRGVAPEFFPQAFRYDAEGNCYVLPAGPR